MQTNERECPVTKRTVRIEIDPECAGEEIVIRAPAMTPELGDLRAIAEGTAPFREASAIPLNLRGEEFWIPPAEILFFLSSDDKTTAHTERNLYYSDRKLCELPDLLPPYFFRVSKSCIANLKQVRSLRREMTGVCEVHIGKQNKTIYVSRMYYKPFRERLMEIHGIKS